MLIKKRLAYEITAQFHSSSDALEAQYHFEIVHQAREMPEIIPEFNIEPYYQETKETPSQVFRRFVVDSGLASSNSEAKRLLEQGAMEKQLPDGSWSKLTFGTPIRSIQIGNVIKRGSRRFIRITGSSQRA